MLFVLSSKENNLQITSSLHTSYWLSYVTHLNNKTEGENKQKWSNRMLICCFCQENSQNKGAKYYTNWKLTQFRMDTKEYTQYPGDSALHFTRNSESISVHYFKDFLQNREKFNSWHVLNGWGFNSLLHKKNQFELYDSDHRTKFDIALLNWLQ